MENLISETLRGAGRIAMNYFGGKLTSMIKDVNPHSVVTEADIECDKFILGKLRSAHSDYGVVSEESGITAGTAEHTWYVDPLDGTRNFETRVPLFGISIALAHKNVITHGGIYLPATDELVYSERGQGAYLNSRMLKCSEKLDFRGSIGIGMVTAKPTSIAFLQALQELTENTAWVNSMGCVAQAAVWTADGRRDYYLTPNPNAWDLAAASLIFEESGCVVTDLGGNVWQPGRRGLIAANTQLHPRLLEIAKQIF